MHVLFLHQSFPGQFGRFALEMKRLHGWRCSFLVEDEGKALDSTRKKTAQGAIERLESMGYCRMCARDAAHGLLRFRLS